MMYMMNTIYSFQQMKNNIINKIYIIFSIFVILTSPILIIRFLITGWELPIILTLPLILLLWFITIFRNKISFLKKLVFLLALFYSVGVIGLVGYGLVGLGLVWFIIFNMVAAIFFDKVTVYLLPGLSTLTIGLIGLLTITGKIAHDFDLYAYVYSKSSWVAAIVVIPTCVGLIIVGMREYYKSHLAVISQLDQTLEESRLNQEEIAALLHASKAIPASQTFDESARIIFDSCIKLIKARSGKIVLLEPNGVENEIVSFHKNGDPEVQIPVQVFMKNILKNKKVFYQNNLEKSDLITVDPLGGGQLENVLFSPIIAQGVPIGVIGIANKESGFSDRDARLAQAFSDLASVALMLSKSAHELRNSEKRYRMLFTNMLNGCALHKIISDQSGEPADFIITEVNPAYKKLTNTTEESVINKKLKDVLPEVEKGLIQEAGEVALSGKSKKTQQYIQSLDKYFSVSLFSPEKGYLASILEDITDRVNSQNNLEKSLDDKETLLRELYHRTKNNMQVIIAMLDLKCSYTDSPEIKKVLMETANKVQAMSLVHKKLYQSKNLSNINIREYVTELAELIRKSYSIDTNEVSIELYIDDFTVLIDLAIPLGLVINELLSNIFKHAFPDGKGTIEIKIEKAEDMISLYVQDNGIGLSDDFDINNTQSLGLQTVFALVEKQLLGEIDFKSEKGLTYIIHFSSSLYSKRV